jgi:DNA-directed RNA polymerase specialized sigma24 family protein
MFSESGLEAILRNVPAPAAASPEVQCASAELRRLVNHSVQDLKLRHRRLIFLRYQRGLTFSEIAGDFDVVESAAHAMHARALRAMREALREQGIQSLSDFL